MIDTSSLPLSIYDGSFESQLIFLFLYLRAIIYYLLILCGIITMGLIIISPILITYFGINSLKISIKDYNYRETKRKNKEFKNDNKTLIYMNRLEKNIQKEKKNDSPSRNKKAIISGSSS
jgi:hypothetical protein